MRSPRSVTESARRYAPKASSPGARATMRANRPFDTAPERALRSALHRRGLRFRVHKRPEQDLRTKPDIVFVGARVVIFVDGCFWHACPEHGVLPRNNRRWWQEKLQANVNRDRRTDEALRSRGWIVIRVWEHEGVAVAADRIDALVRNRLSHRVPEVPGEEQRP